MWKYSEALKILYVDKVSLDIFLAHSMEGVYGRNPLDVLTC